MARTGSYRRQLGRYCWGIAFSLLGGAALAQVNANVEFSNISQTDPHPVTYTWSGKKDPVMDPTHYYTFYYTGKVNPDARVEKDAKIERIAVSHEDWDANYKWITLKLKYYYQLSRSIQGNALGELNGEAPAAPKTTTVMPGQPGAMPGMPNPMGMQQGMMGQGMMGQQPGMGMDQQGMMGQQPGMPTDPALMQNNNIDPATGQPIDPNAQQIDPATGQPIDPNMMTDPNAMANPELQQQGNGLGMGPLGTGAAAFDAQAAAEWTFYYDQLVLWQYYCARQILDKEGELLEPTGEVPPANGAPAPQMPGMTGAAGRRGGRNSRGDQAGAQGMMGMMQQQQGLIGGQMGGYGNQQGALNPEISLLDMASSIQPGEAGKATIEAIKRRQRLGQTGTGLNSNMFGMNGQGMMGPMGDMYGGGMMNQQMTTGANGATDGPGLRQPFNPIADYMTADPNQAYLLKFQAAAEERENELYKNFQQMISDIDEREVNQEKYQKWLDGKRTELHNFANDWRKADEGDVFTVDGTLFVVTKDPAENLPLNSVNVLKGERVTPQDILNEDGSVKKPKVE